MFAFNNIIQDNCIQTSMTAGTTLDTGVDSDGPLLSHELFLNVDILILWSKSYKNYKYFP